MNGSFSAFIIILVIYLIISAYKLGYNAAGVAGLSTVFFALFGAVRYCGYRVANIVPVCKPAAVGKFFAFDYICARNIFVFGFVFAR